MPEFARKIVLLKPALLRRNAESTMQPTKPAAMSAKTNIIPERTAKAVIRFISATVTQRRVLLKAVQKNVHVKPLIKEKNAIPALRDISKATAAA